MDIDAWLSSACEDARRRELDGLVPLLETLARSTRALRAADTVPRAEPEPPRESRSQSPS